MKITVFWVPAPCGLVEVYRRFRRISYLFLMMEVASTSETSVNFYQSTRRNNPEDSNGGDMVHRKEDNEQRRWKATKKEGKNK
jgi:hypothetical protein